MIFKFEAYRELKRYLGGLDGLIELNELAIRKFKSEAEDSGDIKRFIRNQSDSRHIFVNYRAWPVFQYRIYQKLLVSVYSAFERFIDQLKPELARIMGNPDFERIDKSEDNKLRRLIRYFGDYRSLIKRLDERKLQLFDYYHMIRNYVVHNDDRKGKKHDKIDGQFHSINLARRFYLEYYKIDNAPNRIMEISFDDYLLFSKLVKDLMDDIVSLKEISHEDAADLVEIKKFKKFLNHKQRFEGAITNELKRNFGVSEADAKLVASIISARNNAKPKANR